MSDFKAKMHQIVCQLDVLHCGNVYSEPAQTTPEPPTGGDTGVKGLPTSRLSKVII